METEFIAQDNIKMPFLVDRNVKYVEDRDRSSPKDTSSSTHVPLPIIVQPQQFSSLLSPRDLILFNVEDFVILLLR